MSSADTPARSTGLVALLAVATLLLTAVTSTPPATATPVCDGADKSLCGGRTFPEPIESATALTYAETAAGLRSLAEEFPDWLTVTTIGTSVDGHDVLMAELTAPEGEVSVADRKVVLVSQSIHGNEPGGREGGVRYIEDLLRGVDPERAALLDRVRLVQLFLNPDGWVAGDHDAVPDGDSVGLWARGNGNGAVAASDVGGVDLNRNAPWRGYLPESRPDPVSEPETQALVDEVDRRLDAGEDLQASTDIHGEVTDAAAWIMLSSGEFDLQEMTQQRQHGEAVDAAVEAALDEEDLLTVGEATGQLIEPAILTASSEFGAIGQGGSGTGFVGDWLAQREGGDTASISTIELFATDPSGPGLNSLTARREVLQVYVETVRAILGALLDQAVVDHVPAVDLPGTVGYVEDPTTVTDPVLGEPRSQMRFFDDLQPYVDTPLVPLAADGLDEAALSDLDGVIVATGVLEDDGVAALRAFAESGGDVVLTDEALTDLPTLLPGVAAEDVQVDLSDINQVDFEGRRDDPLLEGLRTIAFLLTEPATLGYDTAGGSETPAWRVDTAAWEAAGGRTTGVIAEQTGVGQAPLGDGTVTVIGQLLPPPRAEGRILYGINDHAVLDTGYAILFNALGATVTETAVDVFAEGPLGLEVALSAAEPAPFVGDVVALTATVTAGSDAVEGVEVIFDLPEGVRPTGHLRGCDGTAERVTCPLDGALDTGGTGEVRLDVVPTRIGDAALDVTATTTTAGVDRAEDGLVLQVGPPASPTGRAEGPDRIATAIAASRLSYTDSGASGVVLARADAFPDALAGGVLAARMAAPLLLTPGDDLPDAVAAEIDRVLGGAGPVHILGGPAAISEDVAQTLSAAGFEVSRIGGADRFETAVSIADAVTADPATVFLATGHDFPDALAAGAAAAEVGGVVVLTAGESMPAATQAYLDRAEDVEHLAVGGSAAAAAPDADGVVGDTRYDTAARLATRIFPAPQVVGVATGQQFPDALAGVASIWLRGGPVVLAESDRLPEETRAHLATSSVRRAILFGGPDALSASVEEAIATAMG